MTTNQEMTLFQHGLQQIIQDPQYRSLMFKINIDYYDYQNIRIAYTPTFKVLLNGANTTKINNALQCLILSGIFIKQFKTIKHTAYKTLDMDYLNLEFPEIITNLTCLQFIMFISYRFIILQPTDLSCLYLTDLSCLYLTNVNIQSYKIKQKQKQMELKFNPQETVNCSTQVAYTQYKKWLSQNGVIVDPRVRYPSYFGQKGRGVIGVSVSKPIQKNKVIIAVPYNLLITMDKVLGVQILKEIVSQNSDVFGVSEQAAMKMLILFVCYQLLRQKQSFYYPYFQICKDTYLERWSHWEMVALQNKELMKALKRQKQQIEMFFLQFLRIFTKYDNVFPSDKGNMFYQKLFERAYNFVTTRAFGWSLPSISLIPMADSLNHGNNYLNHYLVDTLQQKDPSLSYARHRNKSNLSILKQQNLNLSQSQLAQLRKKRRRRFEKFIQKHKQIVDSSIQLGQLSSNLKTYNCSQRDKQHLILSQQYKSQVRNFRQLHFYESSCSEDNDTEEDQLADFATKREEFQFDQKYGVGDSTKPSSKKSLVSKYWKLWTDNRVDEGQSQQQSSQQQKGRNKVQQAEQKKQSLQKYQQKHKESQGSSQVSSTQSQQDDQNFDWMEVHAEDNYQTCFFAMQTRAIVRQNEEVHNFYGRRTNRFLLQSYNFVMPKNQYDSFTFRLYTDPTIGVKPNSAQKLIYVSPKKSNPQKQLPQGLSRQVRLKRQRINIELINHCRCYSLQFQKKQFSSPLRITLPFDRQIQLRSLKLYKQILQTLISQYMTDAQDDQQLLQKTVQHQIRTAILYRIMQKDILKAQIQLINKCIDLLTKRWKNTKIQKPTWKDFNGLAKIKEYVKQLQRGKLI